MISEKIYVRCICCTDPMTGIMDVSLRDTCAPCGGISKFAAAHDKWYADFKAGLPWRKLAA